MKTLYELCHSFSYNISSLNHIHNWAEHIVETWSSFVKGLTSPLNNKLGYFVKQTI